MRVGARADEGQRIAVARQSKARTLRPSAAVTSSSGTPVELVEPDTGRDHAVVRPRLALAVQRDADHQRPRLEAACVRRADASAWAHRPSLLPSRPKRIRPLSRPSRRASGPGLSAARPSSGEGDLVVRHQPQPLALQRTVDRQADHLLPPGARLVVAHDEVLVVDAGQAERQPLAVDHRAPHQTGVTERSIRGDDGVAGDECRWRCGDRRAGGSDTRWRRRRARRTSPGRRAGRRWPWPHRRARWSSAA